MLIKMITGKVIHPVQCSTSTLLLTRNSIKFCSPGKGDITVGEMMRAAGGSSATMKLAKRRLNAVGGINAYCEKLTDPNHIRKLQQAAALAESLSEINRTGNGKYLLVHYDEIWFWALVLRAKAKACKELGVEKKSLNLFHKNHIDKVMCLAITGYAYENNIENGGIGLKLGFYRCERQRLQRGRSLDYDSV